MWSNNQCGGPEVERFAEKRQTSKQYKDWKTTYLLTYLANSSDSWCLENETGFTK